MPAPKGNKNALGNTGGKSLNDRQLAAEVRSLALGEIKKILEQGGLTQMKKEILLKIAPSLLPRLNEVSGNDGEPIAVSWLSQSPTILDTGHSSSTMPLHVG